MVKMTPVESSAVASIGHDPELNELHVNYKNGGRYIFPDVTADHHTELLKAQSIGKHLNTLVVTRKGRRL
jgi:KTSC domain